jgi:hypothetical protein
VDARRRLSQQGTRFRCSGHLLNDGPVASPEADEPRIVSACNVCSLQSAQLLGSTGRSKAALSARACSGLAARRKCGVSRYNPRPCGFRGLTGRHILWGLKRSRTRPGATDPALFFGGTRLPLDVTANYRIDRAWLVSADSRRGNKGYHHHRCGRSSRGKHHHPMRDVLASHTTFGPRRQRWLALSRPGRAQESWRSTLVLDALFSPAARKKWCPLATAQPWCVSHGYATAVGPNLIRISRPPTVIRQDRGGKASRPHSRRRETTRSSRRTYAGLSRCLHPEVQDPINGF